MRNLNLKFLVLLLAFSTAGCSDENEPNAVPVAPILKEVVMPAESKALPGTTVTISGKGFDVTDKLFCESLAEELDFAPEIASVNDQGISFAIPMEAAGPYAVKVERAGLTSRLPGELKVPYIIVIDDLYVPAGNVARGAVLAIRGKGFEAGDQAVFSSDGYPGSTTVATGVKLTQTGIEVTIPEACYGVNTLTVVRGTRQANLGRVNVAVSVGDEVGGGIVYYTSDNGTHGLIVKRTNTGSMTQQWGPTSLHGGTKKDLYAGRENTRLCVAKMADFHQQFATWPADKLSAAELCAAEKETVDGVVYDDWFLPSQQELVELFQARADGLFSGDKASANLPANNYWTSTEGDNDANAPIWSAYYVNFYETTNLVTANSDKEGWQIGIRAVRQF